jgi:hypothetical protein
MDFKVGCPPHRHMYPDSIHRAAYCYGRIAPQCSYQSQRLTSCLNLVLGVRAETLVV